jgi:hypothetical protein
MRGQTRIPVMEEVVEYDDEGNKIIVEKHKLLIPDLEVPDARPPRRGHRAPVPPDPCARWACPSPTTLMVGVDFDIEDEMEEYNEELVKKTVAQQEAKMKTYKILHEKNLPIPPDLKAEVESRLQEAVRCQGCHLPVEGSEARPAPVVE